MKNILAEQAKLILELKEKLAFITGYNKYCKDGLQAKINSHIEQSGFDFAILQNNSK